MIVSFEHSYLFIENPLTASTSIHYELISSYGGQAILHKHSTINEFRKVYPGKRELLTIISTRNPLDKIVSQYVKYKTDSKGVFSDLASIEKGIVDYHDLRKFNFVQKNGASFDDYFLKYHTRPFSDLADLCINQIDFILRYENLQADFSIFLQKIGLEQVRPLPKLNVTEGKKEEWLSYYTPQIIPKAKRICGPFMKKWGYSIPESWGDLSINIGDQAKYSLIVLLKKIYEQYFRYNLNGTSRLIRYLRSALTR